ncbi:Two-component response regulator ARR2 [Spatholobus suberectus]|nr:Two-component response regulator ARR2 [Spatholobus suberectus]
MMSHLSKNNFTPFNVNVLVVDGDAIALNITMEILTSLNYKVISIDNSEEIQRKAVMSGVMRYILKPAKPDDLIGIWQFAISVMKDEMPTNTNIIGDSIDESSSENKHHKELSCTSFTQEESRAEQKSDDMEESSMNTWKDNGSSTLKKTKIFWTKDLQSRFVKAIDKIGLENAVPKNILKAMNVEGLTRDNVASHLQKYRLYLGRVERIFASVIKKANEDNDVFLSKMASTHSSLLLKLIQDDLEKNLKQNKRKNLEYLESSDIYISHLRSKLSWSLSNSDSKHYRYSKMYPYFKMGLPSGKTNNLGITNNTTIPYHPYPNVHDAYQPRSASNFVQNIYNETSQNPPISPSGLVSYNFNKLGLGQPSSSNVTNGSDVTSFQGRARSSQIQSNGKCVLNAFDHRHAIMNDKSTNSVASIGLLKPNSTSLVGGVGSTTSEVYSINQTLPRSIEAINTVGNIFMGGNLFQPQQHQQIYNQGYHQTLATVDNNFASQVASNKVPMQLEWDYGSIESIFDYME